MSRQFPQRNHAIAAARARGSHLAIWCITNAVEHIGISEQAAAFLLVGQVPKMQAIFQARRPNVSAFRLKYTGPDGPILLSGHIELLLTALDLPDPESAVIAYSCDGCSIGRKRQRINASPMTLEGWLRRNLFARVHVP